MTKCRHHLSFWVIIFTFELNVTWGAIEIKVKQGKLIKEVKALQPGWGLQETCWIKSRLQRQVVFAKTCRSRVGLWTSSCLRPPPCRVLIQGTRGTTNHHVRRYSFTISLYACKINHWLCFLRSSSSALSAVFISGPPGFSRLAGREQCVCLPVNVSESWYYIISFAWLCVFQDIPQQHYKVRV